VQTVNISVKHQETKEFNSLQHTARTRFNINHLERVDFNKPQLDEQIGQGRLTNDALIAMSARRLGLRVITVTSATTARSLSFVHSSGKWLRSSADLWV